MSLDNLSTTQTVTAPNTQTIISLAVPGTERLLSASLRRQTRCRSQDLVDRHKGGKATAQGRLVRTGPAQPGSRPPVSGRLTGQMDSQISILTIDWRGWNIPPLSEWHLFHKKIIIIFIITLSFYLLKLLKYAGSHEINVWSWHGNLASYTIVLD